MAVPCPCCPTLHNCHGCAIPATLHATIGGTDALVVVLGWVTGSDLAAGCSCWVGGFTSVNGSHICIIFGCPVSTGCSGFNLIFCCYNAAFDCNSIPGNPCGCVANANFTGNCVGTLQGLPQCNPLNASYKVPNAGNCGNCNNGAWTVTVTT